MLEEAKQAQEASKAEITRQAHLLSEELANLERETVALKQAEEALRDARRNIEKDRKELERREARVTSEAAALAEAAGRLTEGEEAARTRAQDSECLLEAKMEALSAEHARVERERRELEDTKHSLLDEQRATHQTEMEARVSEVRLRGYNLWRGVAALGAWLVQRAPCVYRAVREWREKHLKAALEAMRIQNNFLDTIQDVEPSRGDPVEDAAAVEEWRKLRIARSQLLAEEKALASSWAELEGAMAQKKRVDQETRALALAWEEVKQVRDSTTKLIAEQRRVEADKKTLALAWEEVKQVKEATQLCVAELDSRQAQRS